jgi:hypothetical protein
MRFVNEPPLVFPASKFRRAGLWFIGVGLLAMSVGLLVASVVGALNGQLGAFFLGPLCTYFAVYLLTRLPMRVTLDGASLAARFLFRQRQWPVDVVETITVSTNREGVDVWVARGSHLRVGVSEEMADRLTRESPRIRVTDKRRQSRR